MPNHGSEAPSGELDWLPYPESAAQRTRWITRLRPERALTNFEQPVAMFVENERNATGQIEPVLTVILTSRECGWHCLMCDLWKHTATSTPPTGSIPRQIEHALLQFPRIKSIKLYNSGSFFDPKAIAPQEDRRIAELLNGFSRVIVESHPRIVGDRARRFRDQLAGQLEIAVGLETVDEPTLEKLNKRVTLADFEKMALWMQAERIDLRTFILVRTPFQTEESGASWACRSIDFAFDNLGATVASLIPTRGGNGALEALSQQGLFSPPRLETLEAVTAYGVQRGGGRVFADLWNLESLAACPACFLDRRNRLEIINHTQRIPEGIGCSHCGLTPS